MIYDDKAQIPSHYVFADRSTGLIRGWALTRHPDLQEIADTEITVEVHRRPNLAVDKYVNITTGELLAEQVS